MPASSSKDPYLLYVATLQPYSGWKSLASVQVIFDTDSGHWHCLHPACSWKVYGGNFHRGRKKGKHTPNKIPEKKSLLKKFIESFPAVESHHCRKGADKQKENKTNKKNPPRIQFVHQLNVPSGWWRRNEQGVPAGVQRLLPSHSLQTITLLSIDQTKTSAYCVHSYVNDEETNPLSPDMKKFREHQKRRKESRAEKDGDKKKKKKSQSRRKSLCGDIWHAGCSPDTTFCRRLSHYKRKLAIYNLCLFLGW